MTNPADTAWVVDRAKSLGFDLCGVVHPEKFPELERTADWLARGYAGEMDYLADPRRTDIGATMPGVRSVIVCLVNYHTGHPLSTESRALDVEGEPRGWVSRYAWGDDYHDVVGKKLERLLAILRERFPMPFHAKPYVDTGPVQERILAKYAGLGWLGKNTLLLHPTLGSYFFLGVILTTLDLEPTLGANELPPPDLCGSCRHCLDACPTQAFPEPYVMDARKCISYLTIELRGVIPEEHREKMGNHVFGCDICQDVCPWNRRAPISTVPQFQPRTLPSTEAKAVDRAKSRGNDSLLLPRLERLTKLSEIEFREFFRGSPVKRAKWRGLLRNVCVALGNSAIQAGNRTHAQVCKSLKRLAASNEPIIAESAQWALSRIQ